MEKEILKYANGMNANNKVLDWLENNVTKDKPQGEVEHIIDYIIQTKQDFFKATYNRVSKRAKEWLIKLNKGGVNIKDVEGVDVKTIKKWKEGFRFVKLISENAYKREGFMMGHCSASYYGKEDTLYSLRDKNNKPHATLSSNSLQIKGHGNGSIHPKYIKYNVEMLRELGLEVRENEMKNLGYIDVEDFKKYLSKETIKDLFNGKYHYLKNKLLDKENEEFACFELLDKIPLIEYNKKNICNINFNLGSFNNNAIKFLFKKISFFKKNKKDSAQIGSSGNYAKIGSSGDYAQIGSSGYSAKIGSSGDSAKIGSSGYYAKIGSSGYYAKIGSSGNYAKIGSSGDYAQIGSSGYYAKIGSSGDYAKIGSSGDYAKIGSSGNDAQIGSSGNDAQIGSSGDDAQIGSSGNYAKIGSSGYSAQISSKGQDSIIAGIGINTIIKAKKGNWITLAEYDKNNKPLFVKSAIIDGIKLKEDVFYKLKNKRFVMVKMDKDKI